MFRFMIQKLTHKKWMVLSLLIGNIFLIAVAASCPLYKNAALQRMLTDEFNQYMEKNDADPGVITFRASIDKKEGVSYYKNLRSYADEICEELHLTPEEENPLIEYQFITVSTATALFERQGEDDERKLQISAMSDLNNHINIVSGRTAEGGITEDGFIEVIVSSYTFTRNNLMLGDEFCFEYLKDAEGNPYNARVVGIFENDANEDGYWTESSDEYGSMLFMDSDTFDRLFVDTDNHKFHVNGYWYIRYDYSTIKPEQVNDIYKKLQLVQEEYYDLYSKIEANGLSQVLETYTQNCKKINVTLLILQVPVMVLLCAFLYMISDQMLQMERNEISLLKSRGAGRKQIILMYLLQSVILASVSLVIGLLVSVVLCKAIGSSNAFLEFVSRRSLAIRFNGEVFRYAFGAMAVSIAMTVLPVIRYSKVTIVNLKQSKARSTNPFWQRFFLDFVILAVGCYGYYNFSNQQDELLAKVLMGKSMDPLLYLSSSLFILGAAMVVLRIQPLLVKLLYHIGARHWKPAAYSSFLQTIRTGGRQSFIMLFLVLTVALGIFNATVARTILSNAERNQAYVSGADLVLQEEWPFNERELMTNPSAELEYYEPDYGKYQTLEDVNSMTKVYHYANCLLQGSNARTQVVGINTKEFGETVSLEEGLLTHHYFDYLNVLSTNSNAALVSASMRDTLGYKLGDTIKVESVFGKEMTLTIYGFVSYWPGYVPETTTINPDGSVRTDSTYLVIAHFDKVRDSFGERPYEIWIDLEDSVTEQGGTGTGYIYDWAEEHEVVFQKFTDNTALDRAIRNDTMFQGTNGILTMSFIIILILCVIGFLIYWILSIRSRELLFGVFRAMGMSRREILNMLIDEQLFSSVPAILCGAVVGVVSSYLFVPLLQIAYASENQILPLEITMLPSDMVRLFGIIIVMFIICIGILAKQVFDMKISQALKLGED